jgi:ABC-type Fe3+ transport system permease subunit
VWLFDAQVGGLALAESLRLVVLPVLCQIVVLAPAAWWVARNWSRAPARHTSERRAGASGGVGPWLLLSIAAALLVFVPLFMIGQGTLGGLARVFQNAAQLRTLLKEILIGTGYALAAAIVAMLLSAPLMDTAPRSGLARAGVLTLALPGMFGSLVLSLALVRLLQQPGLESFYKTPPALALGKTFFLFPRALLLRWFLASSRRREGLHLAILLGASPGTRGRAAARELSWQLHWRGEFWCTALLSYWGFLELTIAYLLAPVSIVSAPVILYNQMHFGKNATLSARVLITVLVPAFLFVLASASRRSFFRRVWQ